MMWFYDDSFAYGKSANIGNKKRKNELVIKKGESEKPNKLYFINH